MEPIHSRPTDAVSSERVREDPANIDGYIQDAFVYVDMQAEDEWVDCFKLNGDTYDMTVCPCFYPSIVCRAMDDEAAHNRATSNQIQEIITGQDGQQQLRDSERTTEVRRRSGYGSANSCRP